MISKCTTIINYKQLRTAQFIFRTAQFFFHDAQIFPRDGEKS